MNITVTGTTNKKLITQLKIATEFYARRLMHKKTVSNLTIDIEISKKHSEMGGCINEDATKRSRWFTIELRNQPDDDDIFRTLAHEMVHVKQYVKNELGEKLTVARGKNDVSPKSTWNGVVWKPNSLEHPYFDSPWEIEAFGREIGLYYTWEEFVKNGHDVTAATIISARTC